MITAARYIKGYGRLERYERKLSRTVLRRGGASNRSSLFGSNSPGFYFTIDVDNDKVELSMIDEDGYYYRAIDSAPYEWDAGETHTVMLHACNGLIKGEIDGEEVLSSHIGPLRYYFNPYSPFNMTVNYVVGHACAHFDNVIVGGAVEITPPACSILINDAVEYTTDRTVTLNLSAEDPESAEARRENNTSLRPLR